MSYPVTGTHGGQCELPVGTSAVEDGRELPVVLRRMVLSYPSQVRTWTVCRRPWYRTWARGQCELAVTRYARGQP